MSEPGAKRVRLPPVDGVLLVDKPKGPTSHDIVSEIRRRLGQREVGHTGTLDPMATGLLVMTLGAGTRVGRFLENADKTYEATLKLGRSTTTEDAEGETVEERAGTVDFGALREAALRFVGELDQRVPAYSAVQVGGERLHAKARRGEVVDRPVRRIVVHAFDVLAMRGDEVEFRCRVSKGTYVRTLGVDLAAALGLPGHLCALRRTTSGPFRVESALAPVHVERSVDPQWMSLSAALRHLPAISVEGTSFEWVRHGRPLRSDQMIVVRGPFVSGDPIVIEHGGEVVAVAESHVASADLGVLPVTERGLSYACVLMR